MAQAEDIPLVDQIVERLVTAVAIGEFLPGSSLPPERDLSGMLGVGRTTTRAALEVLAERGLIVKRRGRTGGTFVSDDWPAAEVTTVAHWFEERWGELVDASTASTLLHGAIARLAAEKRTSRDVTLMRERLAAFHEASTGSSKQRADSELHLVIIASAHNDSLRSILLEHERRLTLAAPAHPWGAPALHRRMESRAAREHDALVDAIVAADPDEAARIARMHVGIDLELLEHSRAVARERAAARPLDAPAPATHSIG